jgi:hypothetical protein
VEDGLDGIKKIMEQDFCDVTSTGTRRESSRRGRRGQNLQPVSIGGSWSPTAVGPRPAGGLPAAYHRAANEAAWDANRSSPPSPIRPALQTATLMQNAAQRCTAPECAGGTAPLPTFFPYSTAAGSAIPSLSASLLNAHPG